MMRVKLAFRLAWRGARAHKLSTALTVLLVALPVTALVVTAVLGRTSQISVQTQLKRAFGSGDALVRSTGERVTPASEQELVGLLPPGTTVVSDLQSETTVTSNRKFIADHRAFSYDNPVAAGIIRQDSGRAPRSATEADVSSYLAGRLHLRVGQQLRLGDQAAPVTIVGTVTDSTDVRSRDLFTPSGTVASAQGGTYIVKRPAAAQALPVTLPSGDFVVDRNPNSFRSFGGRLPSVKTLSTGALVAVLALLEATLTAGTAFAVGARRARRDLALVAVNGGRGPDVAGVVLALGAVCGVIGIAVGVLGGIGISVLAEPLLQDHTAQLLDGLRIDPPLVAAAALFGLITSVLASILPAHLAARTSLRAALGGARGVTGTPRWITATGLVMLLAGGVITGEASGNSSDQTTAVLFGVVLVELGGVAVCPALLGFVGRLGAWLPALPRLALRDASRQRARSGPAVGAIAAAVSGAIAVSVYVASTNENNRRNYQPSFTRTAALVQTPYALPLTAEDLRSVLGGSLAGRAVTAGQFYNSFEDGNSDTSVFSGASVTSPALLDLLGADQSAEAAFAAGKPIGVENAPTTIVLPDSTRVTVSPLVWADENANLPSLVFPPRFATAHHLVPDQTDFWIPLSADLSNGDRKALMSKAADSGLYLELDTGPDNHSGVASLALLGIAALFSLVVTAAATALAAEEARVDLAVLGAVGATGRVRRLFTAAQGATMTVLGGVLGVAIGLVPGIAVVEADQSDLPLVLPWSTIAGIVIGLPVLAALGGLVFSRSRLPGMARAL